MAKFGQGVNAQLGAISYDDYLRGAMSGSQMTAQGNAAIGQGIGAGLQAIEKGMETRAEINSVVNSTKKLLSGFEDLTSIPEDTKKQMRSYLTQLDSPDLTDRDRGALAKQLGSYANVIVGEGFKKSFQDQKNQEIAAAVKSMYTTQTPQEFMDSAKLTLAGKPQEPFVPTLDESKIGNLLAVMPADQAASYLNALSNREKVRKGDPKLPYEIAKLQAGIKKDLALAAKAGEKPTGYATEAEAFAAVGGNSTNTSTYFSGGRYYPRSLEANQEGSIVPVTAPNGQQYNGLVFGGKLVHPDTKIPIFGSVDIIGQTNTPKFNPEYLKLIGIKVEDPVQTDGAGAGGAAVQRFKRDANGNFVPVKK